MRYLLYFPVFQCEIRRIYRSPYSKLVSNVRNNRMRPVSNVSIIVNGYCIRSIIEMINTSPDPSNEAPNLLLTLYHRAVFVFVCFVRNPKYVFGLIFFKIKGIERRSSITPIKMKRSVVINTISIGTHHFFYGIPDARSRNTVIGSFAFTTPLARRTPSAPSSNAFATSFPFFTPAPQRIGTFSLMR